MNYGSEVQHPVTKGLQPHGEGPLRVAQCIGIQNMDPNYRGHMYIIVYNIYIYMI